MSQVRFHIEGQPPSEWLEETILNRQQGQPTAVVAMGELRGRFPSAAIRIERRGDVRVPNPVKMFRYKIFVKDGVAEVRDGDGTHLRSIKNTTLQSRGFQEHEREQVIAEIKERFPEAVLTSIEI